MNEGPLTTEGGDWHAIHVIGADHPDDWDLEVLHPETCQVTISHPPDDWMGAKHFTCSLTDEVTNSGYEQIFGEEPVTVGWYFVNVSYYSVRTMEGDDVDQEIQTIRVMPPRHRMWELDRISLSAHEDQGKPRFHLKDRDDNETSFT